MNFHVVDTQILAPLVLHSTRNDAHLGKQGAIEPVDLQGNIGINIIMKRKQVPVHHHKIQITL